MKREDGEKGEESRVGVWAVGATEKGGRKGREGCVQMSRAGVVEDVEEGRRWREARRRRGREARLPQLFVPRRRIDAGIQAAGVDGSCIKMVIHRRHISPPNARWNHP
jgi:hypothetical protein